MKETCIGVSVLKFKLVMIFLSVVFFLLYFNILQFLWNAFVPLNTYTNVLSIIIIVVVIIPASIFSAIKFKDLMIEK